MSAKRLLLVIGPGILVAATGVGAGDLATAAITGAKLGTAVLWAVLLGAFFKFVLNEGLTRWQLATGSTLLEGAMTLLGRPAQYLFLIYLLVWSFMVAAALMSACGVAAHAIAPLRFDPTSGKVFYGIALSMVAVILVRLGGYRLFEKVMSACIGLMFLAVVTAAIVLMPDWSELLSGLFLPTIPDAAGEGMSWTMALMGGVGGTVTVLCYGYWIREEGRFGAKDLRICRIDLAAGYIMTALFGLGMVVIGSTIQVESSGATLISNLADRLVDNLGLAGKWVFLIGAFGAVFSSMLGVWQSVPYLFTDLVDLIRGSPTADVPVIDTNSATHRGYLYAVATVPMLGLWVGFARMQKLYALVGAAFIPMLALTLLLLNTRTKWVGEHRNHFMTSVLMVLILLFFLGFFGMVGWQAVVG